MKLKTRKTFLTLLLCAGAYINIFAQQEKERISRYVELYKELAMAEMVRTGIPASITLAQGVLETGNGQSDLALNANNHFGIKCKSDWTGETILHDDDAKGECFRKYATVEDSYRDHSDFLRGRPNYASLFLLDPSDYSGWAKGLKKAGYATNPIYAERLVRIIEENDLQQFTLIALQKMGGFDQSIARNTEVAAPDNVTPKQVSEPSAENTGVAGSKKINYPPGVFIINDTKVIYAEEGSSLLAIANIQEYESAGA